MNSLRAVRFAICFLLTVASASRGAAEPKPPVAELKFDEFFVRPIGPKGLVLTERLRDLNGKSVKIAGYVVRQEQGASNRFLLAAMPLELHDEHYGLADDLPAAILFVLPEGTEKKAPAAGSSVSVSGILSVGPREEMDGRISLVRIVPTEIVRSQPTVPAPANSNSTEQVKTNATTANISKP